MSKVDERAIEVARAKAQGRKVEPVKPAVVRGRVSGVERAVGFGQQVSKRVQP